MEQPSNIEAKSAAENEIDILEARGKRALAYLKEHPPTKEKVAAYASSFEAIALIGTQMTACMVGVFMLNHARTRYEVTDIKVPAGTEYVHEDRDTTAILNYFAGRGSLPEHIQAAIYRREAKRAAEMFEKPLPKGFEDFNKEQVRSFLLEVFSNISSSRSAFGMTREQFVDGMLRRLIPNYTWNDRLYHKLWKLEKEVGSPKIRFEVIDYDKLLGDETLRHDRAHYDIATNTAYIHPMQPFQDLVAEYSHADQFNENPFLASALAMKGSLEAAIEAFRFQTTFKKAYDAGQYERIGSLEHDAHEVREPKIVKQLGEKPEEVTFETKSITRRSAPPPRLP